MNDEQRTALAQAVERGPTPYLDGVVRWRLCDLAQWIWEEFRISVSEETWVAKCGLWAIVSFRLAHDIMYKMPMRPRHLKKLPRRCGRNRRRSRQGQSDRNLVSRRGSYRPEEQDYASLGQAGNKADAPHDQQTRSAYIFGAICPKQGKAAALVIP